jgi:CheY-like chemotaxis protein
MLTKLGYEFEVAENGLEAVNILSNKQDYFDLILMDCQMPEMDGYQATRHVREGNAGKLNQTIPIIALTANAMEGDKEKCLAAGMDGYLSKPIQLAKLKNVLEEYLF